MMRSIAVAFLMMVVLYACKDNNGVPSNVLKPDKMQAVMWDIVRADVFVSEFVKKDSIKNLQQENLRLQQKVFDLHKINHEQYYKSYEYYKTKPELMKALLDTIANRVNRKRNRDVIPQ